MFHCQVSFLQVTKEEHNYGLFTVKKMLFALLHGQMLYIMCFIHNTDIMMPLYEKQQPVAVMFLTVLIV